MPRLHYRAGVDTALHGSGLPYGYAVTLWGAGQMLIDRHGTPNAATIFLFALGAAVSWGLLKVATAGASQISGLQLAGSPHLMRAGALHLAAIGGGIGAAGLVALLSSGVAWPLGAFAATGVYLATAGIELALREREECGE